jgi:hypothetical protein
LGGRLNGPVDNLVSSCMSCHGRASYPNQPLIPRNATPANYSTANLATFFANIAPGAGSLSTPGGPGIYLDYSLQLASGLDAYCGAHDCSAINLSPGVPEPTAAPAESADPTAATTATAEPTLPPEQAAAIPAISREGSVELASQALAQPAPQGLPNTGDPARIEVPIILALAGLAALILAVGVAVSVMRR